jgi:glycosyltransferase involved in cell wall biosynthesis
VIVAVGGNVVATTLAAKPSHVPVVTQVHDVVFHLHDGDFREIEGVPCVANSKFTAEKYRAAHGIDCIVVYPFMSLENYRTNTSRANVTFINPLVHKGAALALKMARACPDIPFCFVEVLPPTDEIKTEIAALPNVKLLPPQKDMRKVYGKCKILLAPSLWEEAYGRVATEAQISGIPVIASNRGGLPEAVGPGGILLDPEGPADDWVNALRRLWQDDKHYAELSAAALAYAQRPEMCFTYQIDQHEEALLAATTVSDAHASGAK